MKLYNFNIIYNMQKYIKIPKIENLDMFYIFNVTLKNILEMKNI